MHFDIFVLLHFLAEGTNKVGHTTTSTAVVQENKTVLGVDLLNDPAFIKSMSLNPPVDVFDLVPSPNDSKPEVTQEPLRYPTYLYHNTFNNRLKL